MWRPLAGIFVLSLVSLLWACEGKPGKKSAEIPQEIKLQAGPARPTVAPVLDEIVIKNFSYDPVPLMEAGDESVPVRLHWQSNARACQLILGEQSIDVGGHGSIEISVPETTNVRLRCQTVEAHVSIPVQKKLSIVTLTVYASPEGRLIRWDTFGAESCQLQDAANGLVQNDQPASGQYRVTRVHAPLHIQLNCYDAQGRSVSTAYRDLDGKKPRARLVMPKEVPQGFLLERI